MQKGFSGILVLVGILLLIGAGTGGYYIGSLKNTSVPPVVYSSPSPVQTWAEITKDEGVWQTFHSDENKYRVKFPQNVVHEHVPDNSGHNDTHELFKISDAVLDIYHVCGSEVTPISEKQLSIGGVMVVKALESETKGYVANVQRPNSNDYLCIEFTLPKDESQRNYVDMLFERILGNMVFDK